MPHCHRFNTLMATVAKIRLYFFLAECDTFCHLDTIENSIIPMLSKAVLDLKLINFYFKIT